MSKKIKVGICFLLLIIMISVNISYAISNKNEKEFFEINKEEISPEETLEMTFDISILKYNKFKIVLKSNVDSNDIYAENLTISNNENDISIDVDKEKMNLDKITLYYPIPKEMAIGTKIQFTAQIEIKEENQIVTNELEINNTQNLENEIIDNQEEIVQEITKTITVIEKKTENNEDKKQDEENDNKSNENNESKLSDADINKEQNSESKIPDTEKNNSNQEKISNQSEKMSSNVSSQKMSTSSNVSINNEKQAVYNGSNNNYLSKIEGIELNTTFNKENGTYFVNTSNTDNINIVATAEDSSAKVNITGNDNIQNGNNKILISVTAENGDVRYYRIFVNCEEETDET